MKRKIFLLMGIFLLLPFLAVDTFAKTYEFELSEGMDRPESSFDEFIEKIPKEIKDELPSGEKQRDITEYDAEFFYEKITDSIKGALLPVTKSAGVVLAAILIAAVFSAFSENIRSESLKGAFSFCSSICICLCIIGAMDKVFECVESILRVLSETMLAVLPVMEAVYIRGGNMTAAAVSATGVNLMIAFTETLFSRVIEPLVYTAFILCAVGAVTKCRPVSFMAKALKGVICGAVLTVMTLLTFVLAMQTAGAGAADSFVQKTVKFAIGNYLPIVGGPLSDSFSLLSGSLGVIKQSSGIIAIVAIVIAFLPPFAVILLNRIATGLSHSLSVSLGLERESALLEECKGICTVLIAVTSGAAVMYIIALGIFCKTPLAVS